MLAKMSIGQFVAKWKDASLSERSAAQQHFLDVCALVGQDPPAMADPVGATFTFEKGASKVSGGEGWADVWRRGHFAWEYKGPRKDLKAAYQQLLQYREDLENPPLLVVCDLNRFEVHTNFTGTVKQVFAFDLKLLEINQAASYCLRPPLEVLRLLFEDPHQLRPGRTTEVATEMAAAEFARLADNIRQKGIDPSVAARYLMRVLFCLFAEDVGLLPPRLYTDMVVRNRRNPPGYNVRLRQVFGAMVAGGMYGNDDIVQFNGGLFDDDAILELDMADLAILSKAVEFDWSSIEPAVFGTLFERGLDPAKRSQLGAHYTSKDDILRIVETVLMAPLRRRWEAVKQQAEPIVAALEEPSGNGQAKARQALARLLDDFTAEIHSVRVLDPACGSGNFLYVALKLLLDLEKEVSLFGARHGRPVLFPAVSPTQLAGIEVNPYAHELASVVIWIGHLQWLHDNGFGNPEPPILSPLESIRFHDAILAHDEAGQPVEPEWPSADVIVGNPPFLGGKRLRKELGDAYVETLFAVYDQRVPREADLVTYWFEKARALVETGRVQRVGLLATNSIRGGANRRVLERILATGAIFMAWGDRPWTLDGAAVRVSIVGFDDGTEMRRTLDGVPVRSVNADLTAAVDLTGARRLPENAGLAFMGTTKGGAFDLTPEDAVRMLAAPVNPNGRRNADVVRPWVTGIDLTRRPRGMFIVDFGTDMSESDAALYELPFEHLRLKVREFRQKSNRTAYRERWWLHMEARPAMRAALASLHRYIGTAMVAKHRLFSWLDAATVPENLVIVIAREDDYFFGVLHSRAHELWSLRLGTSLEDRPRYTPTTTFETFPFPWPPGQEPVGDPRVVAIGTAARDLVAKREAWLNPVDASATELKRRTLTNLYNQRPTWLAHAHAVLDAAVFAAYGWPTDLTEEGLLERLIGLNRERAGLARP